MSFWRGICHQVHCSAQAIGGAERISLARQSRRYCSSASTAHGQRICSWNNNGSSNLSWRKTRKTPNQIQNLSRSRQRNFSATAFAAHGHIDPPKPGEEYVHTPVFNGAFARGYSSGTKPVTKLLYLGSM